MGYKENLLKAADTYHQRTGRKESGIGMLILKDAKFFDRVREGAGCTMDTYEKVMEWFEENMPPDPDLTSQPTSPPLAQRNPRKRKVSANG